VSRPGKDIDIVAGFDHLLRRLGEARLISIDWRNLKKTRQEGDKRRHDQRERSPALRTDGKIEQVPRIFAPPKEPGRRPTDRALPTGPHMALDVAAQ